MGASTARPQGAERVLAGLTQRREELIDRFAWAVSDGRDPARLGDVREAAEHAIDLMLGAMRDRRQLTRDDVLFAGTYFRHAMLRGASESELLFSCRQSLRVIWDALSELAGDKPQGRAIVAELSRPLIDYVEVFSEVAAETYAEVQAAMSSSRRQAARGLVEDLLAGRVLEAGPPTDAARRSGLDEETSLLVLSAVEAVPTDDEGALMLAAATLARAGADATEPLYAIREHEVVIVRALRDDAHGYVDGVEQARLRLRRDGIRLAVGISAEHHGLSAVARAYQEAWIAREQLDAGGLIALTTMSPLDYLLLRAGDGTAWRLVPERIRHFIETDLGQAGLLIETLMAYIECDLNAKLAAERLFVHSNTAHYRLGKIAESTGCDLRSQADIIQLALAVRLARAR